LPVWVQIRQVLKGQSTRPQPHAFAPNHRPPDPSHWLRAIGGSTDAVARPSAHDAPSTRRRPLHGPVSSRSA